LSSSSSPPWPEPSSVVVGRGEEGREDAVRVGAAVRDVDGDAAVGRWLEGRVDAERVALALASGEGAALVGAGAEVLDAEPLGRMESAEPTGPEGVASRTRALSAAAVPPATRTAATVSAAIAPDLVTAPR
jgi:hypothetical protein